MRLQELDMLATSTFEIVDIEEPEKVIASCTASGPSCLGNCPQDDPGAF
ncbi:hypothetical protein CLV63_10236 [Murinocardiopsis flavida]|uniref:Uncharacterized protein n=1 Tax=Murinocardiopsis flavida TaxID=645275 RepID=A0A2P8DRS4_9ACTN|nr:hypothetical protein [Murinocardiopsis flavida]PSK99909.1 hypothetical protein CLV63_10236 [Murinocardiopsis flavida]